MKTPSKTKNRKPALVRSKKLIIVLASAILILLAVLAFLLINVCGSGQTVFTQTDWSGGENSDITDQTTGWDQFIDQDSINFINTGEISLASVFEESITGFSDTLTCDWGNGNISNIVSSGDGGSVIACYETNSNAIYLQKFDSDNQPVWLNEILVGYHDTSEFPVKVIESGGNFFVLWVKAEVSYNLYANKIMSDGTLDVDWGGVGGILAAEGVIDGYGIAPDSDGGVVVQWLEYSHDNFNDLFMKKIDDYGDTVWDSSSGSPISDSVVSGFIGKLVNSSDGNIITFWVDNRDDPDGYNIYVQKIDPSDGSLLWGSGVPIRGALLDILDSNNVDIVSDGYGGAFVSYIYQMGSGSYYHTMIQRIDGSGAVASGWPADGVYASGEMSPGVPWHEGGKEKPKITLSEESGSVDGVIVAWVDFWANYEGTDYIIAQKIDLNGNIIWEIDPLEGDPVGVYLNEYDGYWKDLRGIFSDKSGGAVVLYSNGGSGSGTFIQKVKSDGSLDDSYNDDYIFPHPVLGGDGHRDYSLFIEVENNVYVIGFSCSSDISSSSICNTKVSFGYSTSALLTSSIIDTGSTQEWTIIDWDSSEPTDTSISFQTRTSSDGIDWSSWSGPYTTSGSTITSPSGQYIQYRALLSTSDPLVTPALNEVSISAASSAAGRIEVSSSIIGSNNSEIDLSSGISTADSGNIVVDGVSQPLSDYTGGDLTDEDITSITIDGQTVITDKAVMLDNLADESIVITNTDLLDVSITIPDETTIFGPSGWDGTIIPPINDVRPTPPAFRIGALRVEVGSPGNVLFFDQPVSIALDGSAVSESQIKYQVPGSSTWTDIPACPAGGTYDNPNPPEFPGACYVRKTDDPKGTKILTWHFTAFVELIPIGFPSYSPGETSTTPEEISEEVKPEQPEAPVLGQTLDQVQASPIPMFNSTWGATYPSGRVNWALEHRQAIYYLYVNILGRNPTSMEVNWWLQQNDNINFIRYQFLISEEYRLKHGI